VSCLRSPSAAVPVSEAPQWPQNRSPVSFSVPQEEQISPSRPPHSAQ